MSFDPADVRPSVGNWLVVGIMALTFIVTVKFLLAKMPIPGLTELVASV